MKVLMNLFLILACNFANAQVTRYLFVGTAQTESGLTLTYKLQVTDSNGRLSGYSLTDVSGPDETKCRVSGTVNYDSKEFNFNETKVIYTKSASVKADSSYLCSIHARLKIGRKRKTTVLTGSFSAYREGSTTLCDKGKLTLFSAEDILGKMLKNNAKKEPIIRKALDPEPVEKQENYVYEKEVKLPDAKVQKIQPGNSLELSYTNPGIELMIWDAKTIDGDQVSVLFNKQPILTDYTLSATGKSLHFTAGNANADTITINAVSEGSEPMNTARVQITSGSDTWFVDATTTVGKPVLVILKRKK